MRFPATTEYLIYNKQDITVKFAQYLYVHETEGRGGGNHCINILAASVLWNSAKCNHKRGAPFAVIRIFGTAASFPAGFKSQLNRTERPSPQASSTPLASTPPKAHWNSTPHALFSPTLNSGRFGFFSGVKTRSDFATITVVRQANQHFT